MRYFNPIDRFIIESDKAIKTLFGKTDFSNRAVPGQDLTEPTLSRAQQKESMRLMRINHAGEVSAQAMYQGQALTAKLPEVRASMEQAALEESDHLAWCGQRVNQLGGFTSVFNPLWYLGSLALGAAAGKVGDKWSLGFVAETETQVVQHLEQHLERLTTEDTKSRAILEQMREDEAHHKVMAVEAGGANLAQPIKQVMSLVSKVMIAASYRL
ncbi:MAG: ubiquinone biosynthesis monooxygenase Coq7 [Methylophagaceae bacterium]|jgi:ubiquinone biosynthesis monooxygenase Coq7